MFLVFLVQAVLAGFLFIAAGLSTVWALFRKLKPRQVVLCGAITMGILFTALLLLGRADPKVSPWISLQQYFGTKNFEEEWKADYQSAVKMGFPPDKLDGFKDDYKKYFYDLYPAWVASGCLVFGLLSYYFFSFVLSRITTRVPRATAFREWMIPEPLVFGLIMGVALKVLSRGNPVLDLLGSNLFLFFSMIYALGGFSILAFFYHKWRLPTMLKVLGYFILVQLILDIISAIGFFGLFGVLDIWFDFRKLKNPRPEPTT